MTKPHLSKPDKRTYRELQYRKMAEGYRILKSPVAGSYHAAAEHYKESDPPLDFSGPGDESPVSRKTGSD